MAHGPYLLSVVGDRIATGLQVESFLWESASTAGDTVEIRDPATGILFWRGRASGTQTYLGISWRNGISCPNGLILAQRSSGTVLVYPREN